MIVRTARSALVVEAEVGQHPVGVSDEQQGGCRGCGFLQGRRELFDGDDVAHLKGVGVR